MTSHVRSALWTLNWPKPEYFILRQPNVMAKNFTLIQRYTYRVLQTIQMKVILLWVWAEGAVLGGAKTALKFKYEIQIG